MPAASSDVIDLTAEDEDVSIVAKPQDSAQGRRGRHGPGNRPAAEAAPAGAGAPPAAAADPQTPAAADCSVIDLTDGGDDVVVEQEDRAQQQQQQLFETKYLPHYKVLRTCCRANSRIKQPLHSLHAIVQSCFTVTQAQHNTLQQLQQQYVVAEGELMQHCAGDAAAAAALNNISSLVLKALLSRAS